jgi:hypothetical protein
MVIDIICRERSIIGREMESHILSTSQTVQGEGLSTNLRDLSITSAMFFDTAALTSIEVTYNELGECFKKNTSKLCGDQIKAPLGVDNHETHFTLVRTCLEVYVDPSESDW